MLVALAVAALFTLIRFDHSSDLGIFLPNAETLYDRLLRQQLDNSASSSLVLIALTGLPARELAQLNNRMLDRIRATGLFSRAVNNSSNLGADMLEFIERNRYLLTRGDLHERFSAGGFSESLHDRLAGLASAASPLEKQYVRQDPTGEVLELLEFWQGKVSRYKQPSERQGVWFSRDGKRTLILCEIRADVSDMQNQLDATQAIRNIYDEIRVPGLGAILSGPAVFATETSESIKRDGLSLTLAAIVLVLAFLLAAYRSLLTTATLALPIASGVLVAVASVLLLFGHIHGVTLVFGMTLIGVAIDYPVHVLSAGSGQEHSRVETVWRTLRLGVISTLVAYFAFLLSDFNGLQQLGVFTIGGLLAASLTARWILPLIPFSGNGRISGLPRLHDFLKRACTACGRFRMAVPVLSAAAILIMAAGEREILHLNVDSLSPIKQDRRVEGRMLRNDIGVWTGGSMLLITGADKQAVLRDGESLETALARISDEGVIEAYDMPSHFLPSVQRQERNLEALKQTERIRGNLATAMEGTPFRPEVFEPFLMEIETAGDLVPISAEDIENTVIGEKLEPLLFDFEDGAVGIVLLHGVADSEALERFAHGHEGVYYMHIKSASTDLVTRSVIHVSWTMAACLLVIYLVLSAGLRSPVRPFRVMIPTLSSTVVTACILAYSGNPLSIFHLIALLLVIGLGLDYALFFNRIAVNREEWDSTFRSLWVCGITTLLVFGILALSSTPPLRAIGITVVLGTLISMGFGAMWAAAPYGRSGS